MDALNFRETDFFVAQQRVKKLWLGTILFAASAHVLFFTVSTFLPSWWPNKPLLDEVVTVNLVSLPDTGSPPPPPVAQTKKPPPSPEKIAAKPVPAKVQVPVPQQPEVAKLKPSKPISIKPKKRKIRRTSDTRLAEDKERQRKLIAEKRAAEQQELERKQRLAQARLDELRAEQAATKAREELAALIRNNRPDTRSGGSSGSKRVKSVVLNQYLSAVDDRIRRFWILPEMRKWDKGLETVVVLTIRKDGAVIGKNIETKSQDPFYDQFVMKTIQSSLPMPAFPALMSQQTLEIGIRFRPGELVM